MGVRKGFIMGFLGGAVAASRLKAKAVEAPSGEGAMGASETSHEAASTVAGIVERVKSQVNDAMAAAREASAEKEAEMRRRFEEMTRGG